MASLHSLSFRIDHVNQLYHKMTTIKEYLLANGWDYKGKCKCDGKSDQYNKGQATIKVRNDNTGHETPEGRFRLQGKAPSGRSIGNVIGHKEILEQTLNRYGL